MFMFEYRIWKQRLLLHWLFFDVLWFIHNKSPCNLYCKQQIMLLTTPTLHRRPLDVAQKKWLPLEMLSILVYTYLVYGMTHGAFSWQKKKRSKQYINILINWVLEKERV